ncbi:longevity assurance proteins LAG1/LAC1 [Mycena rebaudengoi]|nr:longevity assurance proteins LAG1/LAC1 [Mycena rebaudengoi]
MASLTPLEDPSHHVGGLLASSSPRIPPAKRRIQDKPYTPDPANISVLVRWAVCPTAALQLLAVPPLLALLTHLLLLYLPPAYSAWRNPFTPFFLLSDALPSAPLRTTSTTLRPALIPTTPLYAKSYLDLLLLAYTIVLVSLLRLLFSNMFFPEARAALGHHACAQAVALRGAGVRGGVFRRHGRVGRATQYIMSTAPTRWFHTPAFWEDYPHPHMSGPMKRYYLTQIAYWLQQFLVLTLGLEARRSDHWELVLHHCVTVWMVSWSYLMNVTLLGNAVFMSMDIPDMCLSFSKLLNYLQLERAKVGAFAVFVGVWVYFRHYISLRILYSLRYEFHLVPCVAFLIILSTTRAASQPLDDVYMPLWMRDQMFYALCILQALNLFWLYLIVRILVRTIMISQTDDNRSDDEGDDEEEGWGAAAELGKDTIGPLPCWGKERRWRCWGEWEREAR